MKLHSTYRGVNIWRKTSPGYSMPYTAMTPNGQVAANTIACMKDLLGRTERIKTFAVIGFGGSFERLNVTLYYTFAAAYEATRLLHRDMPVAIWHNDRNGLKCVYAQLGTRKRPELCEVDRVAADVARKQSYA